VGGKRFQANAASSRRSIVPQQVLIEIVRSPTDEVRELIGELEAVLSAEYPPEQRHGLSLDAIFAPHILFFVARLNGAAVGCGGVALFADFAEAKRLYVRQTMRGRGVAQALLGRLEAEARSAGLSVLRLETGDKQQAAIRLYERAGFTRCGAFGAYAEMAPEAIATSVFFEKRLAPQPSKSTSGEINRAPAGDIG
jgi:putative acetyltransferase